MTAARKPLLTEDEYLASERVAVCRSEYVNGERVMMTGASYAHNVINSRLFLALGLRLKGTPCQAVGQDMRTLVSSSRLYTYPDVLIVCGKPQFLDGEQDAITNPVAIFEILSPSTESWDRGGKFLHYQRIESLQEYVLVTQDTPRVERFRRDGARWTYERIDGPQAVLTLDSPPLLLPLAEIYEGLDVGGIAEPSPPPRA